MRMLIRACLDEFLVLALQLLLHGLRDSIGNVLLKVIAVGVRHHACGSRPLSGGRLTSEMCVRRWGAGDSRGCRDMFHDARHFLSQIFDSVVSFELIIVEAYRVLEEAATHNAIDALKIL